MQRSSPFSRSIQIRAEILGILATTAYPLEKMLRINELPDYKSRGHGGKHRPQGRFLGSFSSNSKYRPHQGIREIARRQGQEDGTWLISQPARKWSVVYPVGYVLTKKFKKRADAIRCALRAAVEDFNPFLVVLP
jgi:hypothetical protein